VEDISGGAGAYAPRSRRCGAGDQPVGAYMRGKMTQVPRDAKPACLTAGGFDGSGRTLARIRAWPVASHCGKEPLAVAGLLAPTSRKSACRRRCRSIRTGEAGASRADGAGLGLRCSFGIKFAKGCFARSVDKMAKRDRVPLFRIRRAGATTRAGPLSRPFARPVVLSGQGEVWTDRVPTGRPGRRHEGWTTGSRWRVHANPADFFAMRGISLRWKPKSARSRSLRA